MHHNQVAGPRPEKVVGLDQMQKPEGHKAVILGDFGEVGVVW